MKKLYFAFLFTLISCGFGMSLTAHAEATVVDLSQPAKPDFDGLEVDRPDTTPIKKSYTRNETQEQKVLRLERQVSNLTEMNLVSKLEKLQAELQQLRGQLEVQSHDLAQLKEQQKNFYQDLDQRINKVDNKKPTKTVATEEPVTEDKNLSVDKDDADNNQQELQAYETAFTLLNKKQYDKAVNGFQNFITTYPNSSYSLNAHYWLGEIYYLKGKSSLANNEFQTIVTKYPTSQKVPDALLKLGLIAMDSGNYTKAKQHFQKIQTQFPNSSSAKVASLRLKELKEKSK